MATRASQNDLGLERSLPLEFWMLCSTIANVSFDQSPYELRRWRRGEENNANLVVLGILAHHLQSYTAYCEVQNYHKGGPKMVNRVWKCLSLGFWVVLSTLSEYVFFVQALLL